MQYKYLEIVALWDALNLTYSSLFYVKLLNSIGILVIYQRNILFNGRFVRHNLQIKENSAKIGTYKATMRKT